MFDTARYAMLAEHSDFIVLTYGLFMVYCGGITTIAII